MVRAGLREVMGSWSTMAICFPLTCRISAGLFCSRSSPWNRTRPPTTRPAGSGTSRTRERQVTDFPDPDSPTRARVSPASRLKLTPSTALVIPRRVKKYVLRSSTTSSGGDSRMRPGLSSIPAPRCAPGGSFPGRVAHRLDTRGVEQGGSTAELPQLGVEVVTEPVPQQVDREDDQEHGQAREERD